MLFETTDWRLGLLLKINQLCRERPILVIIHLQIVLKALGSMFNTSGSSPDANTFCVVGGPNRSFSVMRFA